MKRKYAPSVIVSVRYHKEEMVKLNKKRGRAKISEYIRLKSLL